MPGRRALGFRRTGPDHGDSPAPAQVPAVAFAVAIPLIAANGALDAYTFLAYDGVFANAQTGNVVLFALGLARPDVAAPLPHLWPVLAFVAGVSMARALHDPTEASGRRRPRRWVLLLQVAVLAFLAAAPNALPLSATVSVIGFLAGLQLSLFRSIGSLTFVPIAMTGNLMRVTQSVHAAVSGNRREWLDVAGQLLLIAVFAAGVALGAVATTHLGGRAAAVPAALLAVDLAWIYAHRGSVRAEPPRPDAA